MERQVTVPPPPASPSVSLGQSIAARMGELTLAKSSKLGIKNAEENRPYFGKTIADLPAPETREGAAIVVVGGPSLHRKDLIARIKASGFKGDIVVADGSLGKCLRQGVIPGYVVSVDGHPTRIVRWFGDPELKSRPEDDYFRLRQDYDPVHWQNEKRANQELLELVNRHGPRIKAILSTSVHASVTKRCADSKMESYWWNPIYDDYDAPGSMTRKLFESNRIPCMVTGGNVGGSAWVFAHAVLRRKHIAVVGMDFGYAPGTPITRTQYYNELVEALGDRVAEAYLDVFNPHLGETWFTDPTYYWYRQIFLEMVADADSVTYNCSEGGILFSDKMPFITIEEFVERTR